MSRALARLGRFSILSPVVVAVGVLSLFRDAWARRVLDPWINIHVLFTLLLCGLLLAQYHACGGRASRPLPAAARELCRQLSRTVYLLLYGVIGVRLGIGIVIGIWHGGGDFNLIDQRFRNGPDSRAFDPQDDFELFLATGLFALVFIRVLAFRLWLRASELAATSPVSQRVPYSRSPASPKPGRMYP